MENKKILKKVIAMPFSKEDFYSFKEKKDLGLNISITNKVESELKDYLDLDCSEIIKTNNLLFVSGESYKVNKLSVESSGIESMKYPIRKIVRGELTPFKTPYIAIRPYLKETDSDLIKEDTSTLISNLNLKDILPNLQFNENNSPRWYTSNVSISDDFEIISSYIKSLSPKIEKISENRTYYGETADLLKAKLIDRRVMDLYGAKNYRVNYFIGLCNSLSEKVESLYLTIHQGKFLFPQVRLWCKKPEYQELSNVSKFETDLHADWHLNQDIAIAETALGCYKPRVSEEWCFEDKIKSSGKHYLKVFEEIKEVIQSDLDRIAINLTKNKEPIEEIVNKYWDAWAPNILVYKL